MKYLLMIVKIDKPKYALLDFWYFQDNKKHEDYISYILVKVKVKIRNVLMKKDNLKRIIKQLETLIEELKSEVYSDKDSYVHPWDEHMKNTPRIINSEDDDGYADQLV